MNSVLREQIEELLDTYHELREQTDSLELQDQYDDSIAELFCALQTLEEQAPNDFMGVLCSLPENSEIMKIKQ